MDKILIADLAEAISELGVKCKKDLDGEILSLQNLCQALGELLSLNDSDIEVADPHGRADFGFFFNSSEAFKRGALLCSDGNALIFGDDGAGGILFVSDYFGGKVGKVFVIPDDILAINFEDVENGKIYWQEQFMEWLKSFKRTGLSYLDDVG